MKKISKAYTLLGVIIAVFFITVFLSSAVEVYIVISNLFQDMRLDRRLLNQLILTDQTLSNICRNNLDIFTPGKLNIYFKNDALVINRRIMVDHIMPPPLSHIEFNAGTINIILYNDANSRFNLKYGKYPNAQIHY